MNLPKPLSSLYYFIRVLSTYFSIDSSALICENTKIMIISLIVFLHDYSQKMLIGDLVCWSTEVERYDKQVLKEKLYFSSLLMNFMVNIEEQC